MPSFLRTAFRLISLALLFLPAIAFSQSSPATPPIQDNSFMIEEGYNQEAGVVQHINTFTHLSTGDWTYTFTQEWPVPGHDRHQLSYTVAANSNGDFGGSGLGDTLLNYRYQLVGNGETRTAFAPRISLLLPTGASRYGRGFGGRGVQINLPLSVVMTQHIVTHWNLGTTLIPNAQNFAGNKAFTKGYNAGQSTVWLVRPRFNLLLETYWSGNDVVVANAKTVRSNDLYLNPGIRWAYNLSRGLQIVPGIGVPIGIGAAAGKKGLFLYLSFEHPLWHENKRKQ